MTQVALTTSRTDWIKRMVPKVTTAMWMTCGIARQSEWQAAREQQLFDPAVLGG
jgi:hypothetical protein